MGGKRRKERVRGDWELERLQEGWGAKESEGCRMHIKFYAAAGIRD
jgi:hypothetical protein